MKTAKLFMAGAILCATSIGMISCGPNDGEGDDHATQNENIGDETMEDDMSGDTTMMGDTTTTM